MAVLFCDREYPDVEEGRDTWSDEAVQHASELYERIGSDTCTLAVVDRKDGLMLFFTPSDADKPVAHHFKCALAGYTGNGVIASAKILEMFGFGTYDDIFQRISHGGDRARYTLGA